jgi:hypothetical protein
MSFFPESKLHALVTIDTSAKTVCDVTIVTQQCKQSQTIAKQGWKSCNQLTIFNLNHFIMTEAMRSKLLHPGPLEWHHLPSTSHENLPRGSKFDGETDSIVIS